MAVTRGWFLNYPPLLTRPEDEMTTTESPPLTYDPVAFRPVPARIPETIGFWGLGGAWQGWDIRWSWMKANIPTPRRQRLTGVAFALRSLPVFTTEQPDDDRPRRAIEIAELFADGKTVDDERCAAADAADAADAAAAYAAAYAAAAANAVAERINQSRVLSLVVPLPGWSPSWQTEAAVGIARHVYDRRAWDELPVLADALDDAGCDHLWLLDALRHPDCPGFRGMWVIDRLTGKL